MLPICLDPLIFQHFSEFPEVTELWTGIKYSSQIIQGGTSPRKSYSRKDKDEIRRTLLEYCLRSWKPARTEIAHVLSNYSTVPLSPWRRSFSLCPGWIRAVQLTLSHTLPPHISMMGFHNLPAWSGGVWSFWSHLISQLNQSFSLSPQDKYRPCGQSLFLILREQK